MILTRISIFKLSWTILSIIILDYIPCIVTGSEKINDKKTLKTKVIKNIFFEWKT